MDLLENKIVKFAINFAVARQYTNELISTLNNDTLGACFLGNLKILFLLVILISILTSSYTWLVLAIIFQKPLFMSMGVLVFAPASVWG